MIDGENKVIAQAIRGEASAFGLLYDHYLPKIYRFVLIKVGRREDAEDLTHQVFLSAFQNMASYRDLGHPFSSWLYRIARNQVIDFYRTRKNEASIEESDPELFAGQPHLQFATEVRLALDQVLAAVRELKPEYQDVVIMRFVDDLTPKEVAGALGKSEGAVKLMQHRAVKALKQKLNGTK